MTGDLISREAAIEILKEKLNRNYTPSFTAGDAFASALHRIKKLPSVDAVPVVHARWTFPWTSPECSVCKKTQKWTSKFCPNCGARMDK